MVLDDFHGLHSDMDLVVDARPNQVDWRLVAGSEGLRMVTV